MDENTMSSWNAKQVYIALGFALATAAELHIDSTPMEGFDKAAYDSILELNEYSSCVVLTLGYRSQEDGYQHAPKVRYTMEQVTQTI